MAGAASARVTVNVGGGGLQPPPQAAAQGLTSLVFNEDFNSLSGIDMADSRQAGFNFYRFKPFGFGVLPTSDMSVSNSVLTINQATGGNDAGYAMGSTCGIGSNQFVGFTATGGGYFEARIANSATGSGGNGWPAFWSMSDDHLWQSVDVNFWEVDFYEKLGNVDQHVFAVHSWATPSTTNNDVNNHATVPGGYNFSDFHIYGMLWQPGNRYVQYRDNSLIQTFLYSSFPWLSGGDAETWPIILGTGTAWPMRVDWVRVWQAPT